MSRKLLSLLLCLVLLISLVPALGTSVFAADENGTITNPYPATDESGNLNLTKTLTSNQYGTYDITMESWASGEVKTQGVTEKIPTDFVVVVDQSGSMSGEKGTDMPTGNPTVHNNEYLEDVADGAYYVKDGDNYYRVYGVKDYLYHYYPSNYWWTGSIMDHYGTERSWFMGQSDATTNIANAFYFREVVDGVTYYQPIKTTVEGKVGTYYLKFSYPSKANNETFDFDRRDTQYVTNGNAPWYHNLLNGNVMKSGAGWWAADQAVRLVYRDDKAYTYSELASIRTGMYINYPLYDRHVAYTKLCYRDINGEEHVLKANNNQTTWEFCDENNYAIDSQEGTRPTYSNLYTFPTTTTRIAALKEALTQFAGAVANETDDFGAVDNRISIVGFSSTSSSVTHDPDSRTTGTYNNTELLTHTERDISSDSTNGWQKSTCDDDVAEYYGKGLVASTNGNTGSVNTKITNAIRAISANGGTQPEDGLNMAYQILTNRGEGEGKDTYIIRSGVNKGHLVDRKTIVIFFTDGQPGNYHESNQYAEANEVVQEALKIKNYKNTSIFSIGVFGESDGNPLTYDGRNDLVDDPSNPGQKIQVKELRDKKLWEFLGGWMETYENTYCLRRQWRPNNAEGYTETANDTIYDYMSVVSSNYPDAENFIAPTWLTGSFSGNYIAATDGDTVRHKSTAEDTNKYYRMASNQDTLVAAFLQAVTMNNQETTSDTSVPLTDTAIFKDKVNLADFDTTGATYTVKWQPVKEQGGEIVNNGNAEVKVNGAAYPAEGINYSGFNYSANFVTSAHPGQKLIITINGLSPKKTTGTLTSNDGNAGVYGPDEEDPSVSITSPTLQFPETAAHTYLIDYNAKMTVATDTTKLVGAKNDIVTGTNGKFVKSGTNVTYQLNSANQADKTADINMAYTSVDSATVYGKLVNVENAKLGWNQITTVPASSVYYDDDLAKDTTPAVTVGDGSGKISGVNNANVSQNATANAGTYYFTFYGTGIDVYCTTHKDGGFVSAAVFTGSGESACVKANRVGSAKTVRDYSAKNIYNTPAVFFNGLPADTYTLKIVANDNAQFKLDGVRVYNPVKATEDGAATTAATELAKTPEANANYLNLRKILLNDTGIGGFTVDRPDGSTDTVGDAVSGVLFIDDMSNVKTMSHYKQVYNAEKKLWENEKDENGEWKYYDEELPIYATEFDAYKDNGPKNEIYLDGQQGITFQLSDNVPVGTKVWIGLSAPVDGSGSVSITGKDGNVSVNSVIDMYYDFTVPASRQITITNQAAKDSGDIISVTNLKITGINDLIPAATANNEQEVLHATKALFRPVTMKSVRMAANNGIDPEEESPAVTQEPSVTEDPAETEKPGDGSLVIDEPEETVTPTPTPSVKPDTSEETGNTIQKLIRSITKSISSFFKSIFRR